MEDGNYTQGMPLAVSGGEAQRLWFELDFRVTHEVLQTG